MRPEAEKVLQDVRDSLRGPIAPLKWVDYGLLQATNARYAFRMLHGNYPSYDILGMEPPHRTLYTYVDVPDPDGQTSGFRARDNDVVFVGIGTRPYSLSSPSGKKYAEYDTPIVLYCPRTGAVLKNIQRGLYSSINLRELSPDVYAAQDGRDLVLAIIGLYCDALDNALPNFIAFCDAKYEELHRSSGNSGPL